jgi:outer membrane murein-binding lipoprotein Lpp
MKLLSLVSIVTLCCFIGNPAFAAPGDAALSPEDKVIAGFTEEERVQEIDSELNTLRPAYDQLGKDIKKDDRTDINQMKRDHQKIGQMIDRLETERQHLIDEGVPANPAQ